MGAVLAGLTWVWESLGLLLAPAISLFKVTSTRFGNWLGGIIMKRFIWQLLRERNAVALGGGSMPTVWDDAALIVRFDHSEVHWFKPDTDFTVESWEDDTATAELHVIPRDAKRGLDHIATVRMSDIYIGDHHRPNGSLHAEDRDGNVFTGKWTCVNPSEASVDSYSPATLALLARDRSDIQGIQELDERLGFHAPALLYTLLQVPDFFEVAGAADP